MKFKSKLKKILDNQQGGTAIFMTVMILMIILFISMSASRIVMNGLQMNVIQLNATKAYYAAEAGAEYHMYNDWRKNHLKESDITRLSNKVIETNKVFWSTGDVDKRPVVSGGEDYIFIPCIGEYRKGTEVQSKRIVEVRY